MEVILREDFAALGFIGDKVNVRSGYARNFLIPRGIALEARVDNKSQINHALTAINSKKVKLRGEAEKLSDSLKSKTLSFTLKSGEAGKIFGSITHKDIESELVKAGFAVDRRRIRLPEPLRRAGSYSIEIRLHSEVTVSIPVEVKIELLEEKKEEEAGKSEGSDKPRRGSRGKKAKKVDGEEHSE